MCALIAQAPSKKIGAIAEFLRRALNATLRRIRDIAGERSIVQDNRDRSRRETALLGNFSDGNDCLIWLSYIKLLSMQLSVRVGDIASDSRVEY